MKDNTPKRHHFGHFSPISLNIGPISLLILVPFLVSPMLVCLIPGNAIKPGFYRPPPEDSTKAPMFQLMKGKSSKSSTAIKEESVRMSQASSAAYEGDSEL